MTSVMKAEEDKYNTINFEETELRLGLTLSRNGAESTTLKSTCTGNNYGKRGFSETNTITSVDLKLNLSSTNSVAAVDKAKENITAKPPAKAQVVGWPPVRSFRKNIVSGQRSNNKDKDDEDADQKTRSTNVNCAASASFVKVSMDGAPYLRKVDLKLYKSYQEISDALAKMFSSFTVNAKCGSQGIMKDFINHETNLIHLLNGCDYVPTYEDKDGDWMLVGDVPWEMFVESCKRLRIMKGSEAIGLAPRAVEKFKNRS